MDQDLFEQELTGHADRSPRGGGDRKTLQLCRQVERALSLALAGECRDDVLRELAVGGVTAMGSASQLMVCLRVPATVQTPLSELLERLDTHAPRLRRLVATAICRK